MCIRDSNRRGDRKTTLVVAERLALVPELKEDTVGEAAGEKELATSKLDVGVGRKFVLYVQGMEKLENRKTVVKGSEKVAEDVTHDIDSEMGMPYGIEEEMFASDGESALDVERGLFRVEIKTNKA